MTKSLLLTIFLATVTTACQSTPPPPNASTDPDSVLNRPDLFVPPAVAKKYQKKASPTYPPDYYVDPQDEADEALARATPKDGPEAPAPGPLDQFKLSLRIRFELLRNGAVTYDEFLDLVEKDLAVYESQTGPKDDP